MTSSCATNLDTILEALLRVPENEAEVLDALGYDRDKDHIDFIDATQNDLDNIKISVIRGVRRC